MKKMKTIHRTGTSTCRAEWKSPSGLGLKLRVCSPGVVGALAVTGTRLPTKSCTRLDCSNATSTSLHSYDFVSITCTYISPLNPATRNMPINREVKPVEEHRAVRTTHSSTKQGCTRTKHSRGTTVVIISFSIDTRSARRHAVEWHTWQRGQHPRLLGYNQLRYPCLLPTAYTITMGLSLCGPWTGSTRLHEGGARDKDTQTPTPHEHDRFPHSAGSALLLGHCAFLHVLHLGFGDRIEGSDPGFLFISLALDCLRIAVYSAAEVAKVGYASLAPGTEWVIMDSKKSVGELHRR